MFTCRRKTALQGALVLAKSGRPRHNITDIPQYSTTVT